MRGKETKAGVPPGFRQVRLFLDPLSRHNVQRVASHVGLDLKSVSPDRLSSGLTRIDKGRYQFNFDFAGFARDGEVAGSDLSDASANLADAVNAKILALLPKQVFARDLTSFLAQTGGGIQDPRIQYDATHFGMKFFVLEHGFQVRPGYKRKVEFVDYQSNLRPPCSETSDYIHTYDLAPQTAQVTVGEFDGEIDVGANLKFGLPNGLPWLSGGAQLSGTGVYKTSVCFSRATITASSNTNATAFWEFQADPTSGKDPRGLFQLRSIIGVPASMGTDTEALSKKIALIMGLKARVGGFVYRNAFQEYAASIRFG